MYRPTISPLGLIPLVVVKLAPGKSIDVSSPPLSRKPWVTPALMYRPTISPLGLFLLAKVTLAPGTSIVVNVPSVPCAIAVLRLGAIPADRAISAASAKTRRDVFADLIRVFMGFFFLVQADLRR